MDVLAEIVAAKRREVEHLRQRTSLEGLRRAAGFQPHPDFGTALLGARGGMGLIAEIKQRSPSRPVIRADLRPGQVAASYQRAGVQAVSVLADRKYFGGGEDVFRKVREAIDLPLLYKEFVVDPIQVWHAAALGASAVLLIAALHPTEHLRRLVEECREADLTALVEVHDESDLDRALQAGAFCIGVNNRDLSTLKVDMAVTRRLVPQIPSGHVKISESGISSPHVVRELVDLGVQAVLVGEHLLRQPDPGRAAEELMREVWGSS
ncbi:MAG TPA: indole-3-glycerol phosphate synthase TrpC [Kiritimatiellae bacterium]|nr:indole-3-glycerol phosphate synthase TrpC [Kiritimatiellia bacterium]